MIVSIGQRIEAIRKYILSFENISFKSKFQTFNIVNTPNPPRIKANECFKLIVFLLIIAKIIKVLIGIKVVTNAPPNPAIPCSTPKKNDIEYTTKTTDAKRIRNKALKSILKESLKKYNIGIIEIKDIPILKKINSYSFM